MDFWRIPPFSCPSSPTPQTECLQHLQTFTFTLWSSSTLRYQILSSLPFLIFITLKLLNSPPPLSLSLSLSLSSSLLYHTALLQTFPLIPSHSPSPPLSPAHLYPSITHLSSASSTHSHTPFPFHPHLLSCGTLILSSRIFPFLLSLPPVATLLCFFFLHFILSSPAGSFSPQCALPSRPPCPLNPS